MSATPATPLHTSLSMSLFAEARDKLKKKYKHYRSLEKTFTDSTMKLKAIYYMLATFSLALTSVCALLSGSKSVSEQRSKLDLVLFCLLVVASLINTMLSFSDIQVAFNNHHEQALLYKDLCDDIDQFLITQTSDKELESFYVLLSEKEKLIRGQALQPFDCMVWCV